MRSCCVTLKTRTSSRATTGQVSLVSQVSASRTEANNRIRMGLRQLATNVVDTARRQIVLNTNVKAKLNKIRGSTKLKTAMNSSRIELFHLKFFDFFWLLGVLLGEDERLRERRDRFDESSLFDLDLVFSDHALDCYAINAGKGTVHTKAILGKHMWMNHHTSGGFSVKSGLDLATSTIVFVLIAMTYTITA